MSFHLRNQTMSLWLDAAMLRCLSRYSGTETLRLNSSPSATLDTSISPGAVGFRESGPDVMLRRRGEEWNGPLLHQKLPKDIDITGGKESRLSSCDITIHDAGTISTTSLVPEQSEQYTNW